MSLPFLDYEEFRRLEEYNLFDDFEREDLYCYFCGRGHIPESLDLNLDEAGLFFMEDREAYYKWFNSLNDKSLNNVLKLYIEKLDMFLRNNEVRCGNPS
jgi:hypothetical protein